MRIKIQPTSVSFRGLEELIQDKDIQQIKIKFYSFMKN